MLNAQSIVSFKESVDRISDLDGNCGKKVKSVLKSHSIVTKLGKVIFVFPVTSEFDTNLELAHDIQLLEKSAVMAKNSIGALNQIEFEVMAVVNDAHTGLLAIEVHVDSVPETVKSLQQFLIHLGFILSRTVAMATLQQKKDDFTILMGMFDDLESVTETELETWVAQFEKLINKDYSEIASTPMVLVYLGMPINNDLIEEFDKCEV